MDNNKGKKFIYNPNQYIVKISQCKMCKHRRDGTSCNLYDTIPISLLINKEVCSSKEQVQK